MRFRSLIPAAGLLAAALSAQAQKVPLAPARYAGAEIAPAKTSIYLGNVTLTIPTLARSGADFVSSYAATVFPFFFFNEEGRFHIVLPDADLSRLSGGQPIDFVGQAVRDDGAGRLVQGHAVPRGPTEGDVKFRVYYSRHIVLVFNTTYRLMGAIK
jgi:hypothetical protein